MEQLTDKISVEALKKMAEPRFGNLIKAVVDVRQRVIVVDAELHADEEAFLLEHGSRQQDLWGINLYPDMERNGADFIEFDSMINLRPSQNNWTRGVDDEGLRKIIVAIVNEWVL